MVGGGCATSPQASSGVDAVDKFNGQHESIFESIEYYEFSDSVAIYDAVKLAESEVGAEKVFAYRFENDHFVGEFYPNSGETISAFLDGISDTYGTKPEIAGFLIAIKKVGPSPEVSGLTVTPDEDSGGVGTVHQIKTDQFVFEAPPVSDAAKVELEAPHEDPQPAQPAQSAVPSGYDWAPEFVASSTYTSGSSQWFTMRSSWGGGASPTNTPSNFGIEFDISLYNEATGIRGSILPHELCGPGFRDEFVAKNYDYQSWSVYTTLPVAQDIEAYVDYNDLLDSCGRNSISVGIRYPQNMAQPIDDGTIDLTTVIQAQPGVRPSSLVGGDLQLVDDVMCDALEASPDWPGFTVLTDCMGVMQFTPPTGVEGHRVTLNPTTRNWHADPSLCW